MRIGIVGTMMSGKTTIANMLVQNHGFTRAALADAVKDDCVSMLNNAIYYVEQKRGLREGTLRRIDRATVDDYKPVFRTLLQWYGTDFWRQFMGDPEHWLERFAEKLGTHGGDFVCDDVRFLNEVEFLRNRLGFIIVRITRDDELRLPLLKARYPDPVQLATVLNHPSETEVEEITPDAYFYNSPPDLPSLAEAVATQLVPGVRNYEKEAA